MDYYILSKKTCLVKINGTLVGYADNNLRLIKSEENCFIEFYPTDTNFAPIYCDLLQKNEHVVENLRTYPLEGGILLIPFFNRKFINEYKTLNVEKFDNCYFYFFLDGYYKVLLITNDGSTKLFNIDFHPIKSTIKKYDDFIVLNLLNKKKQAVYIFQIFPEPKLLSTYKNARVSYENNQLSVSFLAPTLANLNVLIKYDKTGRLIEKKYSRSLPINSLSPNLIHFSFLEEIILNGNYKDYLHPSLLKHENLITNFLGNFFTFTPWGDYTTLQALLIGEKVEKFSFSLSDGLISDIYQE